MGRSQVSHQMAQMIISPTLRIMMLLFLFFFFTNDKSIIALVFTNETDQRALLEFKKMIPTDPLGILATWDNSIPVCKWKGITCGQLHQRVVSLDLASSGLVGSLSPHIGNLSFLKEIRLINNTFHGEIPSEIGKLFRLQNLILANNSFQGQLPTNLSRCLDLRAVIAANNNLSGQIPAEMSYLSKLSILNLYQNHLTGIIPPSFGNLSTSLQVLHLSFNNLEGNIPLEIAKLSNLWKLSLGFNKFSGTIPSRLYNISSLQSLFLSGNMFRGTLPSDLGLNFPKLHFFGVSGNQLHGPIPASIGNASLLSIIDMGNNSFTGTMSTNFGNLHELRQLVLWGNKLGHLDSRGIELQVLLTSLSNCSKLYILDLGINDFQGVFPKSIANLSETITNFIIDENLLHGSIPDLGYSNLVHMQLLALSKNRLTGKIPPSIGNLFALQKLYIDHNSLSGEIPSSIGNLTNLGVLDLRDNGLEGNIPAFLGNCTNMVGIYLQINRLYGPIPREIFGHSSLIELSLSTNFLTGSIPVEVSKLVNLNLLHLSDNKLSGEIPASIAGCLMLENIMLQGNQLQGFIPESIKMMKGITLLDVSRNNLSGQIPKFLGELTFLENLNLSYNMFEGEVPSEGVFKIISSFSIAGNKNLCGGIRDLHLPICQSKRVKRHSSSTIVAIVAGSAAFALLLFCILALICCTRRPRSEVSSTNITPSENQYMPISYGELLQATDGFSPHNLIGEGKYGSVYKGILQPNEQIVAVKVLKLEEHGASRSFFAECEALKNIRHRNLVKIINSCSSVDFRGNDFKALVLEYMENNSLDSWLHQDVPEEHRNLNLTQRLDIAIDVASALDYLHNQCEVGIIHCDLKPSNVLLDKDLCAHVADFGITKILSDAINMPTHQQSSSIGIRGTIGYVAPEYGLGEAATTHGDMYSYGILLLELLTGKRPTDSMFIDNNSLHMHAKMLLSDQVLKIVDPKILSREEKEPSSKVVNIPGLENYLVSLFKIGVSCSNNSPSERMNANDVVNELHKIKKSLVSATLKM